MTRPSRPAIRGNLDAFRSDIGSTPVEQFGVHRGGIGSDVESHAGHHHRQVAVGGHVDDRAGIVIVFSVLGVFGVCFHMVGFIALKT